MITDKRIDEENLIVNGTFDTTLDGWSVHRVSPAFSRARFDSSGRLSQTVALKGAGAVKVTFDVFDYYGVGSVYLQGATGRYSINRDGPYDLDFTVETGNSVELVFTSQSSFDIDNVELYFQQASECIPVQLIENGGFDDSSIVGWENNGRVKGVDNRVQFDSHAWLSQQVGVRVGTPIDVSFEVANYYGPGKVSIPEFGRVFNFDRAGRFDVPFVPPDGSMLTLVTLRFESDLSSFDLDNVELWACPDDANSGQMTREEILILPKE